MDEGPRLIPMDNFEQEIGAEMAGFNEFMELMKKQRESYLKGESDPMFPHLPPVEERK